MYICLLLARFLDTVCEAGSVWSCSDRWRASQYLLHCYCLDRKCNSSIFLPAPHGLISATKGGRGGSQAPRTHEFSLLLLDFLLLQLLLSLSDSFIVIQVTICGLQFAYDWTNVKMCDFLRSSWNGPGLTALKRFVCVPPNFVKGVLLFNELSGNARSRRINSCIKTTA